MHGRHTAGQKPRSAALRFHIYAGAAASARSCAPSDDEKLHMVRFFRPQDAATDYRHGAAHPAKPTEVEIPTGYRYAHSVKLHAALILRNMRRLTGSRRGIYQQQCTISPFTSTYLALLAISRSGSPSKIEISASLPTSSEPTRASIPATLAGLMVMAFHAPS